MSAIIPFLIIIFASVFCTAFFNKKFEEVLPLSFMSIMFVLYTFGLFDKLLLGVYVVTGIIIISYIASIVKVLIGKLEDKKNFILNFFTPSFFVFCALYALCLYCVFGKVALWWDEFSHWCDTVKIMYTTDLFGVYMEYFPSYPNYPPGISLMQYYIMKLDGSFTEWLIFFVQKIFVMSLAVKFVTTRKFNILNLIGITSVIFLTPLIFQNDFYLSAYIDTLLGCVLGFAFAMIFVFDMSKIENIAMVLLSIFSLCIIKEAGTLFAVAIVILLVIEFIRKRKDINKIDIATIALSIFALAYPLITWANKTSHIVVSSRTDFKISDIFNLGSTPETAYQIEALRVFLSGFFIQGSEFANIAHSVFFILMAVILFLIIKKQIKTENMTKQIILSCVMYSTFVIYVVGLFFSYVFFFMEYDALRLASFDRYLGIIYSAFMLFFTLWLISNQRKYITYIVMVVLISFFIDKQFFGELFNRHYPNLSALYASSYDKLVEDYKLIQDDNIKERVLVIEQNTAGMNIRKMKYYVRPDNVTMPYMHSFGQSYNEGDIWTRQYTVDEFETFVINNYDYMLILSADEQFISTYKDAFESEDVIRNGAVFEITDTIKRVN